MKFFKYMSWLLVAMTLSIGLAACGSDDDDDDVSGGKSELVGKWESEDGGWGYKLDSNGKGFGFESDYGEVYDRWGITWKYNNNRLILTDVDDNYKYKEILHVTYLDDDIMMFYYEDEDNEDVRVLNKVRKFSWE